MAAVPATGHEATAVAPPHPAAATAQALYERHHARVLRFCRSRLATQEDAEDAAQTTFCYALGGLQRGVVPEVEIAWLLKIAQNVCLNRWDATRRRGAVEVVRDPQVLQEVAPGREDGGAAAVELERALQHLPDRQRRAIVLREWKGMSYREISAELGLTTAAVETLIFRARRSLARQLAGVSSWAATLKSLLAGAKVAAGVAALATAGAVVAPPLEDRLRAKPEPRPAPPTASTEHVPSSPAATATAEGLLPAAGAGRRDEARPGGRGPSASWQGRSGVGPQGGRIGSTNRPGAAGSPPAPGAGGTTRPSPESAAAAPSTPASTMPTPPASPPSAPPPPAPPPVGAGVSSPPVQTPAVTVDVPAVDVPGVDEPEASVSVPSVTVEAPSVPGAPALPKLP